MARPKKVKMTQKRKATAKAAAAPSRARRGATRVNENSKALFLDHHLPMIAKLREQQQQALAKLRNGFKAAKADGFQKRDFETAFRLKSQMGEKDMKIEIARNLTIANWLGFSLGKQLDLFMEDEPADSVDIAYAAGEEASRSNQPAEPMYAPGTPGYDSYMAGFHDHQEEIVSKGIKRSQPTSGVPMTRSQFKAQQAAKKAKLAEVSGAGGNEEPLFTKRSPDEAA